MLIYTIPHISSICQYKEQVYSGHILNQLRWFARDLVAVGCAVAGCTSHSNQTKNANF